MRTLLKNGTVINVFTGEPEKTNVLIEDDRIIGVGDYTDGEADQTEDLTGKAICPGFIDGHIHIESTMMTPTELARVSLLHGTTSIIADPHEIANVCGSTGIQYMLEASKGLPLNVYIMLPSCVPATPFDESGAVLTAEDLARFYADERVLGLAEMMNYPGVIAGDSEILKKIRGARSRGLVVDGHAPLLSGKDLDRYLSAGIQSDHECSSFEEAAERIRKGQWVMIRQGTAARNLEDLIELFEEPYCQRCLLVTDDKHPEDLLHEGHIDSSVRKAIQMGKHAIMAVRMATLNAAQCFDLRDVGAIAPGYRADLLILRDLESVEIESVYAQGKKVVSGGMVAPIEAPPVKDQILKAVKNSFYVQELTEQDFKIEEKSDRCRVIKTIPHQLLTEEWITDIHWQNNGIEPERDILKIAVIERHMNTGHIGLGLISGIGLKKGAIASSVSHDAHNIVVIGANEADMALAANHIIQVGGGAVCVCNGEVLADVPLPIGGLMCEEPAESIAERNASLAEAIASLGAPEDSAPLMTMAFMGLAVIPNLKITTRGLVDVNKQQLVSLYVED